MICFYILLAILQLENHHLLGANLFGGLTIFKLVGAACVLYALWYAQTHRGRIGFFETWQARLFLVFYFIVVASFIFENRGGTIMQGELMRFTSILLLLLIILATIDSLHKLRVALLCAITSVGIAGFYVFKEWFQYRNVFGAGFRPNGASLDSNYYALSAATCLPIAFCLLLERKSRWQQLICLANIGLMMAGFVAASSRGGLLALGAALLILCWHSKQRVRYFAILSVLIVPAMFLAPSSPVRRLMNPDYGDKIGEDSRKITWMAGVRMAMSDPLTGIGIGNFKSVVLSFQDPNGTEVKTLAHNTYIEIAAELGIPALAVFLGILVFTYLTADRVRRQTARHGPLLLHQAGLGLEAAIVGCMVGMIFLTAHWEKQLWLLVFLSSSLPPLARSMRAASRGAAPRRSLPAAQEFRPGTYPAAVSGERSENEGIAGTRYSPSGMTPGRGRKG